MVPSTTGFRWRWVIPVFAQELRKALNFRTEFLVKHYGIVAAETVATYFLWSSVMAHDGVTQISGFTFPALMFYSILAPLIFGIVAQSDHGFISGEIYDGSFTRYLVYPLPTIPYKFVQSICGAGVFAVQLAAGLLVALWSGLIPTEIHITTSGIMLTLAAALCGNIMYYSMQVILELVAFWAENVWSLNVMLALSSRLLGGILIPIAMFPQWAQEVLSYSPFPYIGNFQVRILMGQATAGEMFVGFGMIFGYSLVFLGCAHFVMARGMRQYSGAGM